MKLYLLYHLNEIKEIYFSQRLAQRRRWDLIETMTEVNYMTEQNQELIDKQEYFQRMRKAYRKEFKIKTKNTSDSPC